MAFSNSVARYWDWPSRFRRTKVSGTVSGAERDTSAMSCSSSQRCSSTFGLMRPKGLIVRFIPSRLRGGHPGDDLGQARTFRDSDDIFHVLIRPRGFLDDPGTRCRPQIDPPLLEGSDDLVRIVRSRGSLAGHLAACAVAARTEGAIHRGRLADEDEGAGAHDPRDQDGLADVFVLGGRLRMSGGERPGRALAVHDDLLAHAVHRVLFHLPDVVTDVVDDPHAEVIGGSPEHIGEGVPHAERNQLSVVPREVRAATHGTPIVLAFLRSDRSARELEVRQLDLLAFHDPFARLDVVARDLMPEAAGTGVDHDADGPDRVDPKGLRRPGVVHPVDLLNL